MAKVKHTKNALKAQRDALRRYTRFLPTLQLKKQQLQIEVWNLEAELATKEKQLEKLNHDLKSWIDLFSEPFDFESHVKISNLKFGEGNIAGVSVPILESVEFENIVPDLMKTRAWIDDGIRALKRVVQLKLERDTLMTQYERVSYELRVTNQRVNLFEKIKIPECKENIKTIQVFLGDEQIAAVARAKTAKNKSTTLEVSV